ncbi:uncharacterized protein A1O9_04847 [Exophiala aquamarina CBS 119918]|uniref:Uncharacterized protein n=1 Tax=Exophiala aquamarina CBS 119918 TaxID=1182545 RepID=A0A072PKY0_9EURO|nr:uncharacterized protein A1O9_04847 [Exophiala aquamarina CBS 119918]KEF59998.1 hypothetical protein A1O9_04847 [Exophiala aquamarina CBS 119918]
MEHEENEVDDNSHIGCYIFKPTAIPEDDGRQPRKRRKISKPALPNQAEHDELPWPSLHGGEESEESVDARRKQFQKIWTLHQTEIDRVVNKVDESFVDNVLEFVRDKGRKATQGRVKTGLIVSGTTRNTRRDILQGWKARQLGDNQEIFIELHPSQCPNLQIALKNVIRLAISQHGGSLKYTTFLAQQKAFIPMNFDLELLQRYIEQHCISRILLSVADVETFDTTILSELIATTNSWINRVPFNLLINISTTIELFESRLSRSVAALMDAKAFHSTDDTADPLYSIYSAVQHSHQSNVFLGPAVLKVISGLAEDQTTTATTFVRAIKYAFMSHFFANPMSLLCSESGIDLSRDKVLCQAIRNTSGFRGRCEQLVKGKKSHRHQARELLSSDEALIKDAIEMLRSSQARMRNSLQAVQLLHTLYSLLEPASLTPLELEAQLINSLPNLLESEIYHDIELSVADLSHEEIHDFLDRVTQSAIDTSFAEFSTEVGCEESVGSKTLSLGAIKESLSKFGGPANPELDKAHALQQQFTVLLTSYLKTMLSPKTTDESASTASVMVTNPFQTYLSEAAILNMRSPLSTILHARPRYALERALTRPADYLGCECCTTKHGEIFDRATLPPASLLLTLLNEAGNVVNVQDLWDAFCDTVVHTSIPGVEGEENGPAPDKDGDERRSLTVFYRALADLRHLGLVRPSKRKPGVDCIVRTAWMGL